MRLIALTVERSMPEKPNCRGCGKDTVVRSCVKGNWFCFDCGERWPIKPPVVKTIVKVTVEGKLK